MAGRRGRAAGRAAAPTAGCAPACGGAARTGRARLHVRAGLTWRPDAGARRGRGGVEEDTDRGRAPRRRTWLGQAAPLVLGTEARSRSPAPTGHIGPRAPKARERDEKRAFGGGRRRQCRFRPAAGPGTRGAGRGASAGHEQRAEGSGGAGAPRRARGRGARKGGQGGKAGGGGNDGQRKGTACGARARAGRVMGGKGGEV